MKITKIEKHDYVYHVTLTPNLIEKLFGVKEKVSKFRDNGSTYRFGSGTVYVRSDGEKTENGSYIGEAIDKWRNSF